MIIAVYYASVTVDKNIFYQMSSFNESAGLGLLKIDATEFVKYPLLFNSYFVVDIVAQLLTVRQSNPGIRD